MAKFLPYHCIYMGIASNKLQSLQALRGLAVVLVIVAHSIDQAMKTGHSHIASFYAFENFGAIGVDIFFVISGVIITIITAQSHKGVGAFLWRRCIRILPLYWLLSMLYYAGSVAGFWERAGKIAAIKTITVLPIFEAYHFVFPIMGIGWTLSFEFFFYMVFAIALAVNRPKASFITLAILSILMLAGLLLPDSSLVQFSFASSPMFAEFMLGIIAGRLYLANNHFPSWLANGLVVGGVVIFALNIAWGFDLAGNTKQQLVEETLSFKRVLVWGFGSFLWVAGLLLKEKSQPVFHIHRLFVTLGDISYSAYLSHVFVLPFFFMAWRGLEMPLPDLAIVLAVVASMLVAYPVFRFIEKPMHGFFIKRWQHG